MGYLSIGGRLVLQHTVSSKKARAQAYAAPARNAPPEFQTRTGIMHPFASTRAGLRAFRRAQGGPGIELVGTMWQAREKV